MPRWANSHIARLLVLSLVLAVTACGREDAATGSGSDEWSDKPWMQQPGTPIVAGLVVPEGAQLIGPTFAELAGRKDEPTVFAQDGYLLIDGDIFEVASSFVEQWPGEDSLGAAREDTVCRQLIDIGAGSTQDKDYTGELLDGAVEIRCEFGLVVKAEDESAGVFGKSVEVNLWQDLTDADTTPQGTIGWVTPPTELPAHLPTAPDGVEGPRSVASNVDYLPDLEIVPGSFLAGPAFPGSLTGGYVAVIGVTGDPDEVFDAYVSQDQDKPYYTADDVFDGLRIRAYKSAEAGGVWLDITLQEKDGDAWMLVEAYND